MTTPPTGPQKSGLELRDQIIAIAEDTIAASGIPYGWHYGNQPDGEPWDPATAEFAGQQCYTTGNNIDHQRLDLYLYHEPVGDTVAFANRVADHWRQRGHVVTPVGTTANGPRGEHYTEIGADRAADGSLLGSVSAQDSLFSLYFFSECSTDPTLANFSGPNGYRTWDPFTLPTETPEPTATPDAG